MTGGKLVRDLIPDLIRQSGRHLEVRYLSKKELVAALVAKLSEEAREAADAVSDRDALVEELADITEVMSALRLLSDISDDELMHAVGVKALQRGRFESGAFLVSAVPDAIRRWRISDVEAQRVSWAPDRWADTFKGHEDAYAALREHSREAGGIARSFIHDRADGDPVDLFLMAMVWGHGRNGYGPNRISAILNQPDADARIGEIVRATRNDGAAAGWDTLLNIYPVKGLGMSFGTKLLYFAGYTSEPGIFTGNTGDRGKPLRPLVLDERVRASLQQVAPQTVPPRGTIRRADYLNYLQLAQQWAADPAWRQRSDVVEYGLFTM